MIGLVGYKWQDKDDETPDYVQHITHAYEVCCHSFFMGAIAGMAYELVMGCLRGVPLKTANIVLACQVEGGLEGWGVNDEIMGGDEVEDQPIDWVERDAAVMPVEESRANFPPAKVAVLWIACINFGWLYLLKTYDDDWKSPKKEGISNLLQTLDAVCAMGTSFMLIHGVAHIYHHGSDGFARTMHALTYFSSVNSLKAHCRCCKGDETCTEDEPCAEEDAKPAETTIEMTATPQIPAPDKERGCEGPGLLLCGEDRNAPSSGTLTN